MRPASFDSSTDTCGGKAASMGMIESDGSMYASATSIHVSGRCAFPSSFTVSRRSSPSVG
jgi:hypothetical protein